MHISSTSLSELSIFLFFTVALLLSLGIFVFTTIFSFLNNVVFSWLVNIPWLMRMFEIGTISEDNQQKAISDSNGLCKNLFFASLALEVTAVGFREVILQFHPEFRFFWIF